MGTSGIPIKEIPKDAKYYFKTFDTYIDDSLEMHKVKLELQLKNIFSEKNIQIQLIYFEDSQKIIQRSCGETEFGKFQPELNKMTFEKFFIINYYFEKEMPLEFRIFGDINAVVTANLPSIMGARAQTFKKEIPGTGIILEIKGFSYASKIFSNLKLDVEINGNLSENPLKYLLIAKGTDENPLNLKLYQSELKLGGKKANKIAFKQCVIPDIYICSDGNYQTCKVCIELYDSSKEKKIGSHTCYLSSLILKKNIIKFDKSRIATIYIDPIKNYSFIDYLRGGMQISLSIAIDFTASNLPITDPKSLHYTGVDNNQYEIAIKACGDIVANYDYNQMFATYGFGGKFYGRQNVDFCFPLNGDENNPEIFGIDSVLEKYRDALLNSHLFGPTFFHYFIENLNKKALEQVQKGDYNKYHILMILTDGIIEDTDETINALVEASFLPISVIIIGIGDADFTNMNVLDADDDPLYDDKERKASRDLVQFVPFKDFQNNPKMLAEEVLREIPRQIVEYYQHQNIPPNDPVIKQSKNPDAQKEQINQNK